MGGKKKIKKERERLAIYIKKINYFKIKFDLSVSEELDKHFKPKLVLKRKYKLLCNN